MAEGTQRFGAGGLPSDTGDNRREMQMANESRLRLAKVCHLERGTPDPALADGYYGTQENRGMPSAATNFVDWFRPHTTDSDPNGRRVTFITGRGLSSEHPSYKIEPK